MTDPGHIRYRAPWFLSNDNGDETWVITDGVETFPIDLASQAELSIAVAGTIERATDKVRADTLEEAAKRAATVNAEAARRVRALATPIETAPELFPGTLAALDGLTIRTEGTN
jgi:hypothetical protein